jgi:ubiquinone/menaquinone biosynthesis C-methylase UbiE
MSQTEYSQLISERLWNQPDKGELESNRETDFIDDIVQKHHIERELLSGLDGVRNVFDAGAGSGRFSILLAKLGLHVVHFDVSASMIAKARELATAAGVAKSISFVHGHIEDLSVYQDKEFDMVISFDAPISYTFPNQNNVIKELVRIAKKRIMISVASRLGALPYCSNPLQKNQFILNEKSTNAWVQWCLQNQDQMIRDFSFDGRKCDEMWRTGLLGGAEAAVEEYQRGGTPWPITYHFMPDELKRLLEECGVREIELAGPGAFARTVPNEILVKIMNQPQQRREFLDFCYLYDKNPFVCGLGKDNLFAKGRLEG